MDFNINLELDDLAEGLLPYLSFVRKANILAGKEFFKSLGKESGNIVVKNLNKLWNILTSKIAQNHEIQEALDKAANDPNEKNYNYLLGHLKGLLADDGFRSEIMAILRELNSEGFSLKPILDLGEVNGEITGVKVVNPEALRNINVISPKIKTKIVNKKGKITGIEL
jgi:hypothetical protein